MFAMFYAALAAFIVSGVMFRAAELSAIDRVSVLVAMLCAFAAGWFGPRPSQDGS